MTAEEAYEAWLPFPDAAQACSIEGVADEGDEPFHVLLQQWETSRVYRLEWLRRPLAYRNIDESYRSRLWQRFTPGKNPFWIVQHSLWVRELRLEAAGACDHMALTHYAIFTDDDCLDVVSTSPPSCTLQPSW